MPYENIWEELGVYRRYNGCVTGKEMREAVEEVEGHVRFDFIRYVINDFLDVTEQDIAPQDIEIIAAIDRAASRSNPDIRIAVIATEQAILDMATFYSELSYDSPYQTRMFSTLSEVREWLA